MLRSLVIRGKALERALGVAHIGLLVGIVGIAVSQFTYVPMIVLWWMLVLVGACCGACRKFRSEQGLWLFAAFIGVLGAIAVGLMSTIILAGLIDSHAVSIDQLGSLVIALAGLLLAWSVFFENRRLAGRTVKVV